MFNNIFRKSCRVGDNVENFGSARQVTEDNKMRRRKYAICKLGN
jgi:hypothetical protein